MECKLREYQFLKTQHLIDFISYINLNEFYQNGYNDNKIWVYVTSPRQSKISFRIYDLVGYLTEPEHVLDTGESIKGQLARLKRSIYSRSKLTDSNEVSVDQ